MSSDDKGIYFVPDSDYDEFISLHHDHVFVHKQASSFLEGRTAYTPILIDLDFRYESKTLDREFTKDHIRTFLHAYTKAFFRFLDYEDSLRFFVELKPTPIFDDKGIKKDGIHILCPDISVEYSVCFALRKYLLEQGVLSCFPGFTNPEADCFDECVIQKNNWFLHGATKPNKATYSVTYCFVAEADGLFEESEWDESDLEFTQLFSVRREAVSPISVRSEMEDAWAILTAIAEPKKIKKIKKNDAPITIDDTSSVVSHLSEDISKILKLEGCLWDVMEMAEGFKLTHNTGVCLVQSGKVHSELKHSCVFVQRTHSTLSCFADGTKLIPKARSVKLWKLLAEEEDTEISESARSTLYTEKKAVFEQTAFRVLHPPGYMVFVEDAWIHYTRPQLIDMNSGIFLDDAKKERFIDWWLRDEHIRTYNRVGYFVDVAECPTTVFNTFAGFAGQAITDAREDCSLVLWHIRHILAAGAEDVYEFILDFLASCVQCPRRLTGICLVVMGQHGSGKDILFNWFGSKVIGMEAYFKTARPHIDMFGSFNSSRLNRVFYHIEEGNSKSFNSETVEQFKNFITDEFASIQLKGVNTGSNVTNYNHFVISSNNAVPFEIHPEERRFFAVRASGEKVRNNEYFTRLLADLGKAGVVRDFYDLLMVRDLSGRDWKNPPVTEAMREWKHSCESDLVQFLEYYKEMNPAVTEIKSSELFNEYKAYCTEHRQEPLKMRQFGMEMKKVVGESVHTMKGSFYNLV